MKIKFFKKINKRKFIVSLTLILLLGLLLNISASAAEIKFEKPNYQSFKLDNGMQFMVFPDSSVPLIKYSIYYNVGSIDEKKGITGISHFLEHLMFLGTENLPEGEIDDLISSVGGQLNAATSFDYTYYYHQVPSSMLELVMALESDRMKNLKFDNKEVNREREVIKQERRMRTENNIFSKGFEEIKAEAFKNSYLEHNVIGWMEDINSISTAELKNHYQKYYSPNNAVVVVSGDVEISEAKKLAEKYYGSYQAANLEVKNFELEEQRSEKNHKVYLETNIPYAFQLYQIPAADKLEFTAVEIFLDILANNQSSRLKENLQKKQNLILESGAFAYPLRTKSFALIYFIPADHNLVKKAQAEFDRELNLIFEQGITDEEFAVVKKQYQKSLIFSQKNINSTAASYALNQLRFNKADLLEKKVEYINQLRKEDIIKTAKKYFSQKKRTKAYILSESERGVQ